ncbi:MAG TPA: nicotinate phosphoribosyltransferase [Rhodanobacteraceae bacterium]
MIIRSLLDTDLYKFTMLQAVWHQFVAAEVEYRFRCRTHAEPLHVDTTRLREEVAALCTLRLQPRELDYLRTLPFLTADFIRFLETFQLDARHVTVTGAGNDLAIVIRGPWVQTILFEVPLLAIVSELQNAERADDHATLAAGQRRLDAKIDLIRGLPADASFRFVEFGTRRRFSRAWQRTVIQRLARALPHQLAGTSNVLDALELGLAPVGTMGHEFFQAAQALAPTLAGSQRFALAAWAREYHGALGIVLADVIGLDAFLRDFDRHFCELFAGVRHDSGDPIHWGERMLAHYAAHSIDPRDKTFVFSDGLDVPTALRIYRHFHGRVQMAFGIGTNLTNDVGVRPPDTIIKMVRCNGQAVAKISDDPSKTLCVDPAYLTRLRAAFAVAG